MIYRARESSINKAKRRIGAMSLCASSYKGSLCSESLDDRVLLRELDDLVDIAEEDP